MKKLFSIIIFFSIFLLVFSHLNKIFIEKDDYYNSLQDFEKLSKRTNIDVLFLGSSHTNTVYNPLIINELCKTISFNLGAKALRLPITNLVFEEAVTQTNPRLVVLEVHHASMKYPTDDEIKSFQLAPLTFIPNYSLKKIKTVYDIYGEKEVLSAKFPLIKNHCDWNKISLSNTDKRKKVDTINFFYHGGFWGLKHHIDKEVANDYLDYKTIKAKKDPISGAIAKTEKKSLLEFVKIAKKHDIDVLIVTSPYIRAKYDNYYFFDALQSLCDSINIPYLNLNDYYDELNLEAEDFSDRYHLSISGTNKTNIFLSDYINNHFQLPDRSQEEAWKESNKFFEKFKNKYFDLGNQFFSTNENYFLKEEIIINKINITRNRRKHKITISLEDFKVFEKEVDNYKLGVHIFPKDSDTLLLRERSKKEGWKFELADFRLKGQRDSIYFEFNSSIRNIDRIEMFLYDESGFKGVIGKSITVKQIQFLDK